MRLESGIRNEARVWDRENTRFSPVSATSNNSCDTEEGGHDHVIATIN